MDENVRKALAETEEFIESTDREPVPAPPEIVWTNEYAVDLKEKYRRLLEQQAKDEVLKQVSNL